jgi:hypothetical protein
VLLGASGLSLGYLLLRLVRDFTDVPIWLMRSVEVGVAVSIAAFIFGPTPLPPSVSRSWLRIWSSSSATTPGLLLGRQRGLEV